MNESLRDKIWRTWYYFKRDLAEFPNSFYSWLAWKLPRGLVYFCAVRVFAHGTTGDYSKTPADKLTVTGALRRWNE